MERLRLKMRLAFFLAQHMEKARILSCNAKASAPKIYFLRFG